MGQKSSFVCSIISLFSLEKLFTSVWVVSSGYLRRGSVYIEDITRWREDMNFIFEWQNNILRTSAASE